MCTVLLPPGVNPTAVNKYTYIYIYIIHRSRSAVQAVGLQYRMDDQGITVRLGSSGTHPALYLTGTECPSPTGKATVREVNHTHFHVVPRIRLSGGLPPFSFIPLLCPQGLLYFYLYFTVAELIRSH